MKKTVRIFCILIVVLFFLTSCSRDFFLVQSKNDGRTVLKIWECPNGGDEFIKVAANSYRALHGNIDFIFETVDKSDVLYQIEADSSCGQMADIFCSTSDFIPYFVENNLIREIEDFSYIKKNIVDSCVSDVTCNGKFFGVPVAQENCILIYNRDLIHDDEVPDTWGEIMAWCRKFNIKNPGKMGLVFDVTDGFVSLMFASNGNNNYLIKDNDGIILPGNYSDAEYGFEVYQRLRTYMNADADELNKDFSIDMFRTGNAAMILCTASDIRIFEDGPVNVGAVCIPSFTKDEKRPLQTFRRSTVMLVSSSTKNYKEACSFVRYLVSMEMQQKRFSLTGCVPAVQLSLKSRGLEASKKQTAYSSSVPSSKNMPAIWDYVGNVCARIWNGENVSDVLENVSEEMILIQSK